VSENPAKTFVCYYCQKEHPIDAETCPETQAPLGAIHKLAGNKLENKYGIKAILGEGGMGVIYECEHLAIGKKLAIKFLNPELRQSQEAYERFKREAQASAIIAHKNIVDVIDIGETAEGIPYIIMEFLKGQDLGRRIADWGRIPLAESREIISQVLEALAAVHSCGVVHRDLKPENVFLARQSGGSEIVKVLDFGISRLSRQEGQQQMRLTKAGYVYGTPNYIAPEQAEGKANVDHRADLYSAGMILYEMSTGQLPFTGESYGKLLVDIITKPIPDPRNYFPDMPQALVNLLMLSLEKDPNMRFQSAQEMLREIKTIDLDYARHSSSYSSYSSSSERSSMGQASKRRTTPVKELTEQKHKDFSRSSKDTGRISSYKIVPSPRSTTSSHTISPTPPPEEKAPKPATPPIQERASASPPERHKTQKTPFNRPTKPTPIDVGSYRIVPAMTEKIYEAPKPTVERISVKKDGKKTIETEDTAPSPVPPPTSKVQPVFSGSYARIERARTLPTPQKAVVKKNLRKNQEVTPTPDSGEDEGSR
jgi:serine/threonine protein kinase